MIDVLANDTDPDAGPMWIASTADPAAGKAKVRDRRTLIAYRPDHDYCGPDSFTYTLNGGSTAKVSITVTCVKEPSKGKGK